ncbi:MAG: hypothetical protein KGZ82_09420 [Bacteroidales bacterium]|nr:hypothetical protein [Bacteroidales bacterium]
MANRDQENGSLQASQETAQAVLKLMEPGVGALNLIHPHETGEKQDSDSILVTALHGF